MGERARAVSRQGHHRVQVVLPYSAEQLRAPFRLARAAEHLHVHPARQDARAHRVAQELTEEVHAGHAADEVGGEDTQQVGRPSGMALV